MGTKKDFDFAGTAFEKGPLLVSKNFSKSSFPVILRM